MKRLAVALLIFAAGLVVSAAALPSVFVGSQTLKAPPHLNPNVHLLCTDGNLVNVTNPDPLLSGFSSGNNGTALFGCGFSTGGTTGILPAVTIVKAGIVNATFQLPANVSIYLITNPGVLGPLSQAQCAAGILLNSRTAVTIPLGSYSYCESFNDSANLVAVTVSWYQ